MRRRRSRRAGMFPIYLLLMTVVGLVAGYALLSQNINVTGTATADANFVIIWQSPSITANVGGTGTAAPSLSNGDTTLTINPVLEYPGAYIEVTATVKNNGGLDAIITGVSTTNPVGSDIVVTYTPTFTVSQTLATGATTQVVIKVQYASSSTNQSAINETFGVTVTYTQDT